MNEEQVKYPKPPLLFAEKVVRVVLERLSDASPLVAAKIPPPETGEVDVDREEEVKLKVEVVPPVK